MMKILRKPLSVLLSILMVFTACSICLTGFTLQASAESVSNDYKNVSVDSSKETNSAGTYSYSADNGDVYYAVKNILTAAKNTSPTSNSPYTLLPKIFGSDTGSNLYNLALKVLLPGHSLNDYKSSSSNETWTKSTFLGIGLPSVSNGDDITNNSTISPSFSLLNPATMNKTVGVSVDRNSYIKKYIVDKGLSIVDTKNAPISLSASYTVESKGKAVATSVSKSSGWSTKMTVNYTKTVTNNYTSFSAVTANTTDEYYNELTQIKSFFDTYMGYTETQFYAKCKSGEFDIDSVLALANSTYSVASKYLVNQTGVDSNVILDYFFGANALQNITDRVALIHKINSLIKAQTAIDDLADAVRQFGTLNPTEDSFKTTDSSYTQDMSVLLMTSENTIGVLNSTDQAIFDELKNKYATTDADVIAFDLATAQTNAAKIKTTFYENKLYNLVATAEDYIGTNSDYVTGLYNDFVAMDKAADITRVITDSDAVALAGMSSMINSLVKEFATCKNVLTDDEYSALVSSQFNSNFTSFKNRIADLVNAGIQEKTLTEYFVDNAIDTYIFEDWIILTDEKKLEHLETIVKKQPEINTAFDNAKNTISDKTLADNVFSLSYYGERMNLKAAVQKYIDMVSFAFVQTVNSQLENLDERAGDANSLVINMTNYFIVLTAYNGVDVALAGKLFELGLLDTAHNNLYDGVAVIKAKLDAFAASGAWNYVSETYEDVTRKATGAVDSNYFTDVKRDGDKDNYTADSAKVENVITKIDSLVTSTTFADLLSLKKTDGTAANNIGELIDDLLCNKLFTNDIINMLVGKIYPLLVNLANEQLADLLKNLVGGLGEGACVDPGDTTADFGLNVGAVAIDGKKPLSGIADVFLNGKSKDEYTSKTFIAVFKELGLYITPVDLASRLDSAKFASVVSALQSAGNDWSAFADTAGKIALDLDWGVTDANSFVEALAGAFSGLEPLVKVLFTDYSINTKIEQVALAASDEIKYESYGLADARLWLYLPVNVQGLELDEKLLVPLYRALGVTNYTLPDKSDNIATIFTKIINPILGVVESIKTAPVDTLTSILPGLLHFLSFELKNVIENELVINADPITLGLYLIKTNALGFIPVSDIDLTNGSVNSIYGIVKIPAMQPISVVGDPINIGESLDIKSLLGFDLCDPNALVGKIAGGLLGANLPLIDSSKVITASTLNGKSFVADKAQVFKLIYDYIVNKCLGDSDFVNGLLGKFGVTTLPDEVRNIIDHIHNNGDDVFAALVELIEADSSYDLKSFTFNNYTKVPSYELADSVTDWTDERAASIMDNLTETVNAVLKIAGKADVGNLDNLLDDTLKGVFTSDTLGSLAQKLKELSGTAATFAPIVNQLTGVDLAAYGDLGTGLVVGNNTYTLDAGKLLVNGKQIDKTTFGTALAELLTPLKPLLDLVLESKSISVLDTVTVTGSNGLDTSLNYVFEMLGADKTTATGDSIADLATAINSVVDFAFDKINTDGAIRYICQLLPRIISFIDSNGLSVVVQNLIHPVLVLLDTVRPVYDIDINKVLSCLVDDLLKNGTIDTNRIVNALLGGDIGTLDYTVDIQNLNLEAILTIADKYLGTSLATGVFSNEAIPQLAAGIVDGDYSKQNDETDTFMILVGALYDTLCDTTASGKTNGDIIIDLISDKMGDKAQNILNGNSLKDVYGVVMDVLSIKSADAMKDYDWAFTDKADTDEVISPFTSADSKFGNPYGKYWTRKQAEKLDRELFPLVENLLCLLGVTVDGEKLDNLLGFVDELPAKYLYTQNVVDKIYSALCSVLDKLNSLEFAPEAKKLVKSALGVDLDAYTSMSFTVTDEASFKAALVDMITPLLPVLECLLCGKDLSFFYSYNGEHILTVPGSEGYAYGLVPVLEALGCKNIKTPAEFKTLVASSVENGDSNAVEYVVDLLTARIDELAADPINKLKEILPAVLYFVNSDGLATAINNLVVSVDTVLSRVYPLFSDEPITVLGLIPFDFDNFTADGIVDMLVGIINDKLSLNLKAPVVDLLTELSTGTVKSYKSVNGETYYTLVYAPADGAKGDRADLMTAVLRIVLIFISEQDNRDQIKNLLAEKVDNETAVSTIGKVLDEIGSCIDDDKSLGLAMKIAFEFLTTLYKATDKVDDAYHNASNAWGFAIEMMDTSTDPYIKIIGHAIKVILDQKGDEDIADSESIAKNGLVKFFQKIIEFIKRIFEAISNMFKIK